MNRSLLAHAIAVLACSASFAADVTHLGAPCVARQVLAGRAVVDRETGRELFVLTNMNEISGMELIFIDVAENTARVVTAPAGDGSWALNEVPGDRLLVGTYYDGMFMVFDLKTMQFTNTAKFEGEDYIWNLAMGGDGRMYGGTYPGGKLGAYDLAANTMEDCGAPAAPNMYLRMVSELPDGRVLCSFGTEKPMVKTFDPATKAWSDVPNSIEGVTQGCVWDGVFLAGGAAYDGKTLEPVTPPYPVPEELKGQLGVDVYLTLRDGPVYLHAGNATYRYAKGDAGLTKLRDLDLRGGRLLAGSKSGALLGVRGQDYFVLKPGDTALDLRRIPGATQPRKPHFLACDPEGRVWGGPTFGQTLFWLDAKTKQANNTGQVCDGGGEVYAVTFWKGKVYAAAYAGGDIVEYDPNQPWDQWNLRNPRPVTSVSPDGFIRPTGGILTLNDGTLVSGWMAAYGTYGGLIALTNPVSGETAYVKNPLGEQAISGVASDGQKLYVTTTLSANGLPDKPDSSPVFGAIDIKTKRVEFQHAFDGTSSANRPVYDAKTGYVAFTMGRVRLFDTKTMALLPEWETPPPSVSSDTWVGRGDGVLYYGSKERVIRLDLATGASEAVATLPDRIEAIALHPSGDVMVSVGPDVYRVAVGSAT